MKFTVLDALQLGYKVNVITDGCRGVNIQPQDSAHAFMEMSAAGATLYTLADWEEKSMRNLVKYVGIGLLVMGLAACDDKDTNATAQGSVAESNATGNPVNLLDGKLSFSLPADMTDQSGKLYLHTFGVTEGLLSDSPFYGLVLICILVAISSRGEKLLFKISTGMVLTKLLVVAALGVSMVGISRQGKARRRHLLTELARVRPQTVTQFAARFDHLQYFDGRGNNGRCQRVGNNFFARRLPGSQSLFLWLLPPLQRVASGNAVAV